MQDIGTYLASGATLIADGATGTMLQAMGLGAGVAPELWNAERPDAVRAHHGAYLDAGSQIILTNSFGANRLKLERTGRLGQRTEELNQAAGRLARAEAGDRAFVAGDMGPTGELMTPYGPLDYEQAVQVYAEQAQALVSGGVDLLWIETMSDLSEAQAAVEGIQQVTTLPVFCSLSFGSGGRTMMGVTPAQVVEALFPMGLAALGANCGDGIEPVLTALTEMRQTLAQSSAHKIPALIAKPNAGLPRLEDGQTVFDLGPEAMAAHVPRLIESGAQVIGACCGSSPAHIAAMASAVKGFG